MTQQSVGDLIPRVLDNTALSTYMECPKKFDYSMRQHRRHRGAPAPALAYGSVWHVIMDAHYTSNGDAQFVEQQAREAWTPHDRPDDHRTLERALVEYDNYVEKYGLPSDEDAQTVGDSTKLIEIFTELSWPGALHPYAGKLDRIIELNGHIYIEDHKTTSRLGAYFFKQFELDNQMMGYAWLARKLTNVPVAGVRINAHAVYKRDSKFERSTISWSDEVLEDWAANYNLWVERIAESYRTNVWPRNFKACAGKYSICQYADICSLAPRIRQQALELDFDTFPWNPSNPDEEETTSE